MDYSNYSTSPNGLGHCDLSDAVELAYAEYGVEDETSTDAPIAAWRFGVDGSAMKAEALRIGTRIGIAHGGDAVWSDWSGDINDAVRGWLTDPDWAR